MLYTNGENQNSLVIIIYFTTTTVPYEFYELCYKYNTLLTRTRERTVSADCLRSPQRLAAAACGGYLFIAATDVIRINKLA